MEPRKPASAKGNTAKTNPAGSSAVDAANGRHSALLGSELVWLPYRAVSRALLQTHKNFSAYMSVNRDLAAEMQTIVTRAQDLALQLSEKTMVRMSQSPGHAISGDEIEEMYKAAAEGIRELGNATIAAQIRSIELLRDRAREAVAPANGSGQERSQD